MNDCPLNQKTILYIEDDIVVLTAYRDRLRKEGLDVEGTLDGLEAMKILAAREFDLIILDLMLPRFSGAEVLRSIRANPRLKHIPVLVFSTNIDSAEDAIAAMADRCLFKGNCSFATLFQSIQDLLQGAEGSKAVQNDAGNSSAVLLNNAV